MKYLSYKLIFRTHLEVIDKILQQEQAIVLSSMPYGSTGIICRLIACCGKISSIVQGLNGKNIQCKRADFQTGSYVELELYPAKQQGGLYRVKESRLLTNFQAIQNNPRKKSELLFICELVDICISEQHEDRHLFDFIRGSISALEEIDDDNFLLKFMFGLTTFLGFEPNEDCRETSNYFDMMAAEFVKEKPTHEYYLPIKFANMFFSLEGSNNLNFSLEEKSKLWHILNTYYKLHIDNFRIPISFTLVQ